ncbi:MAG: hypothetical protein CL928_10330 [Deltaproteobacteria bacterium]|nr:hypothetical protein [Deltaproteobacteria bacterium]
MIARWFDPGRTRALLLLGGPIVAGMASQVVLNLVDTAMIGRLGPAPQAAVGLGSFTFLVLMNAVTCLGAAVQATASRRDGENDSRGAGGALDRGLLLAVGAGLPLGYGLSKLVPAFFPYLASDPAVVVGAEGYSGGIAYLEIRVMAMGVVGANFCYRGFYNGIGRSKVYLVSIVLIQTLNIFFNWVFIYGNLGAEAMDVRGAALASVLAAVIGTCFYTFLTLVQRDVRTRYRPFRVANLGRSGFGAMIRLAWPEAVRGIGLMVSFLLFLELHEAISTPALAAGSILMNIGSAGFLPAMGMGLAGATMVGRHLGMKQPAEARKIVWLGVRLTVCGLMLPAVLVACQPEPILAIFTPDVGTMQAAKLGLQLFAATTVFDAIPIVLLYSMLGAGATRWVAGAQLIQQYLVMLPLAALIGLVVMPELAAGREDLQVVGLWLGLGLSRMALGVVAVRRFRSSAWEDIEV